MKILVLILIFIAIQIEQATAQNTSGDCSPVVAQTDGNVTIICNGELKNNGENSTEDTASETANRTSAFSVQDLAGNWVGRVDCRSSYLPWYTFSARYVRENQIMLTGNFTVTAEATSRFASDVGRALSSTMTVTSIDNQMIQLRLGAQTSGRARRLLNIAVNGTGIGPFTGFAGEGDECAVIMAKS